jgi:hypothetical protein
MNEYAGIETWMRMPITIRDFKTDADLNRTVFRYLTQGKFAKLITTSRIWFCNLDHLTDDPLEGTLPAKTYQRMLARDQELKKQFPHVVPQDQFDTMTQRDIDSVRGTVAVNCWYMGEAECPEMWERYAKHGVAIQSTVSHLAHSFIRASPTDDLPQLGPVKYINFEKDDSVALHVATDAFGRSFFKDLKYVDESELRVAHLNLYQKPGGFLWPCHLANLIQSVVMSRAASDQWTTLVHSLLKRHRLNVPVLVSAVS